MSRKIAALARDRSAPIVIRGTLPVGHGLSTANAAFDVRWPEGTEQRVVRRRYRFWCTWFAEQDARKPRREADVLSRARAAGLPAPAPLALDERERTLWESWLPSERRPDLHRLTRESPFWREAAAILARLHAIPAPSSARPGVSLDGTLALYLRWARRGDEPALVGLLRRLRASAPGPVPLALIHADAHQSNWGLRRGHVVALYDFEHARLADQRIDLASLFAYQPSGRRERFARIVLDAYARAGGREFREDWRWWSCYLQARLWAWLVHLRSEPRERRCASPRRTSTARAARNALARFDELCRASSDPSVRDLTRS